MNLAKCHYSTSEACMHVASKHTTARVYKNLIIIGIMYRERHTVIHIYGHIILSHSCIIVSIWCVIVVRLCR